MALSYDAVRRRLFALAFVDECAPVGVAFLLWFERNGLSTRQVSLVVATWAITVLFLEIPSGALADRVDRRTLLAAAFSLRFVGVATWWLWPTPAGMVTGTVLWAVHDALASGTWESWVHDQLDSVGRVADYPIVMARLAQLAILSAVSAAVVAFIAIEPLGLVSLVWLTLIPFAIEFVFLFRLPSVDAGTGPDTEPVSLAAWWATLKDGVRQARNVPVLGFLVVTGALAESLTIVDEYLSLVIDGTGAAEIVIPIIVGIGWIGYASGAEVAARWPQTTGRRLAVLLAVGSALGLVGLSGVLGVWGLLLLPVLFCGLSATYILADARLQERVEGDTRATVTSVRGFGTGLAAFVVFLAMAALDPGGGPRVGLIVLVAAAFGLAWRVRRLPDAISAGG